MLAENLAGFDQRHLRRQRAVGPDLQDQPVIIGLLADAGVLRAVAHAGHRRINAVHRDQADFLLLGVRDVLRGGDISAALGDRQRHVESLILGQRGDDMILVDDRDRGIGFDHSRRDRTGLAHDKLHFLVIVAVELHDQALDVEDDVRDILHERPGGWKIRVPRP